MIGPLKDAQKGLEVYRGSSVLTDAKAQTQIRPVSDEGVSDVQPGRTPVLVVVRGEDLGRRFPLEDGRHIVGRDPDRADVVVRDPSVSGKHALIRVDGRESRYGLIDLGSRNGTLLNGCPVDSSALRDGDKVFLGETVLKFNLHDSIEADYHSRLNQLMHVDSLTGLFVRRWYDAEYPKAFQRARSQRQAFSILMMDMDGLKTVNDSHGHQLGSYCISEAGKIIRREIQPGGVGCRFGGDEFVAFLPGRDLEAALEVGEAIRGAIDTFDFRRGDIVVAPTISIGAADLHDEASADELARRADEALYRAKEAGRNCVVR